MTTPARHGQRWSRQNVPVGHDRAAQGGDTPVAPAQQRPRVVQVDQLDAFLNAFPRYGFVPQYMRGQDVAYDHTLVAGDALTIASYQVNPGITMVFSDISYYALSPATDRQGAHAQLNPAALVGVLRFELRVGGISIMRVEAQRTPAYAPARGAQGSGGWPWLDRTFGAKRVPAFGLYPRAGQTIDVVAVVESVPRFPIGRVGVEIAGFTVPDTMFEGIWDPSKRLQTAG